MEKDTVIKETISTPSIRISPETRSVVIKGSSREEDPSGFYQDLSQMLEKCLLKFKNQLRIDFYFEYINTSSSKWLFSLLKEIQQNYLGKKLISIYWYYDEDDEIIQEAGEVFQSLLQLPFNMIEVKTD